MLRISRRAAAVVACAALLYSVVHFVQSGIRFPLSSPNLGQVEEQVRPLMQTWLNRALGGDSTLFRAVTFDAEEDAAPSRVPLVLHVAAAALVFPAALIASFGLAAWRRGDTYGAYFRRAA